MKPEARQQGARSHESERPPIRMSTTADPARLQHAPRPLPDQHAPQHAPSSSEQPSPDQLTEGLSLSLWVTATPCLH